MFIDTHAHTYIDLFDEDYTEILARAQAANIEHILMPNIDVQSVELVIKRYQEAPNYCLPMVGLHPCSVGEQWEEDLHALQKYLDHEAIIAVGEIGIDLYWDKTFQKEQEAAFAHQIHWALERDLPIVIHSRAAIDISIQIVKEHQNGNLRGVFHCFDQGWEEAQEIIDLGFYMGIGGVCTYKRNTELRDTIKKIPLEHLILETDAPYLPPVPHRGKRNEPSYLPLIADQISDIKEIGVDQVSKVTSANAKRLFGL